MIRLVLPFPPSVHGLYRGGRWRGDISPEYKAWRDEAGLLLNRQRAPAFTGPVRVIVRLVAPDNRERDSDNYIKAILDLLVAHGVIESDDRKTLLGHYVEWIEEGPPCTVAIQAGDDDTFEHIGSVVARIFAWLDLKQRSAA